MVSYSAFDFMALKCCFCDDDAIRESSRSRDTKIKMNCERCFFSLDDKDSKFFLSLSTKDDALKCFNDPQFFIPKIDRDLLPRFAETLVGFEQYSFAFLSKAASKLLKPEKLIVAKDMILDGNNKFVPSFGDSNILVTQRFKINNISLRSASTKYLYHNLMDSLSSNELFIKAKFIELSDIQITADIFYLLLSPQLLELKCFKVNLTTKLKPLNFIERLPNIEKFIFSNSIDDYTYFLAMIGDLKDTSVNCKDLTKFCRLFTCFDLNFDSFRDIIKGWSKTQINILLILNGINGNEMVLDFSLDNNVKKLYLLLMKNYMQQNIAKK